MLDLDDQSALDALAFDARWQYALDLQADEAYLSRRSFVDFRGRLVEHDPEMALMRGVFDRVGQAAIDDLGLSTDQQRMDSTFLTSNIRTRGRLDLFRKTLAHFLDWLSSWAPTKLSELPEEMRQWHAAPPEGYFGKPARAEIRARLVEVGQWLLDVLTLFADDELVRDSEPYQLVGRLVAEHCERVELAAGGTSSESPSPKGDDEDEGRGGEESSATDDDSAADDGAADDGAADDGDGDQETAHYELLDAPINGGASLQSPYDPDAGYGHKGKGYLVQIAETCGHEDQPEILTDFAVQPANESDHGKSTEALDRLIAVGRGPRELYADAGYASGQAFMAARERDTTLRAPVLTRGQPADALLRDAFTFGPVDQVLRCPGGHEPVRHGHRIGQQRRERTQHAYFDAATCRDCPLLSRCPVSVTAKARTGHLDIGGAARARDRAILAQREKAWWTEYSIRSGIEATNSELKRAHGFGRLRVRSRSRVLLAVTSKLTACNIKRWLRAAAGPTQSGVEGAGVSPARRADPSLARRSARQLQNWWWRACRRLRRLQSWVHHHRAIHHAA